MRWVQRFQSFCSAFDQLRSIIEMKSLNPVEEQGLIQCFEYNFELSWNTIKDFYTEQGETDIQGSRDAFRLAFKRGLLSDGELWMDMIKSRAQTVHTYNTQTAQEVVQKIRKLYYPAFAKLVATLKSRQQKVFYQAPDQAQEC